MEKLVIINHTTHECYIEYVSEEDLEPYGGDEQLYIEDNYDLKMGDYSWDYVTGFSFYPDSDDKTPVDMDPEKCLE